jgi:hypothetical protein
MAAFNQDAGSHAGAARRREELASGERRPVTGARTATRLFNPTGETAEERKARHARKTGTRKSLWK